MLRKLLKVYHYCRQLVIMRNCQRSASVGIMFETKGRAIIDNGSGVKEAIISGNNTVLSGKLMTSPKGRIEIGSYCYIGANAFVGAATSVTIGDYVGIAENTHIIDNNNHPVDPEARIKHRVRVAPGGEGYRPNSAAWDISERKPILIENNVWVGSNCFIGKGVTIGEGSIVARQSVVTKDVPPYVIVAGNPARIVKKVQV